MNKVKTLVLLIFLQLVFNNISNSQTSTGFVKVNRIVLQIPDSLTSSSQDIANYINLNFYSQEEKSRAIFCWIAENIQYDFDNMYAINMYNSDISSDETLKTRRGICTNFSSLYSDIANKVGVKTYVISGYTRNKKLVDPNPHSWCVSMIDSSWYMIDPTWGSGYIQNYLYVKKINNKFFKIKPNRFIKTHIPFDPLWQFLNYPITKQEFRNGMSKAIKEQTAYFNFIDTVKIHEKQSDIERLFSSSLRIESNGISCYLDYHNLHSIRFNIAKEIHNIAFNNYNDGIYMLNEYISYSNNYYLPYKSDTKIKQMLEDIDYRLNFALKQLEIDENLTSVLENEILHLKKLINQALFELKKQKDSLDQYLKIAKEYREKLSNSNKN